MSLPKLAFRDEAVDSFVRILNTMTARGETAPESRGYTAGLTFVDGSDVVVDVLLVDADDQQLTFQPFNEETGEPDGARQSLGLDEIAEITIY